MISYKDIVIGANSHIQTPISSFMGNPVIPTLITNPTFAAQNTTYTNNMGADGYSWSQANPIMVDNFGHYIATAENNSGNHNFVWSNDAGASWTDSGANYIVLERGTAVYDTLNDLIHVLWNGNDPNDGIIYRRYSFTRDGSNNITAITQVTGVNLQLDFQSSGTMSYAHPLLFHLTDAQYGANGALVCMWSARNTGVGQEIRAVIRTLSNTTADNTASNWTHLGINSSTTITQVPASASYTCILSDLTSAAINYFSAYRKLDKNIYFFVCQAGATPPSTSIWKYRKLNWVTNQWTSLGTLTTMANLKRAGTDIGYSLKQQLGTKIVEDSANKLWFGFANWKDNTNGDTWSIISLDATDTLGSIVDVYSALGAHSYAPTGDITIANGKILTSYLKTSNGGTYIRAYSINGSAYQAEVLLFNSSQADIPLLGVKNASNKLPILFRNTAATHVGYFGTVTIN